MISDYLIYLIIGYAFTILMDAIYPLVEILWDMKAGRNILEAVEYRWLRGALKSGSQKVRKERK